MHAFRCFGSSLVGFHQHADQLFAGRIGRLQQIQHRGGHAAHSFAVAFDGFLLLKSCGGVQQNQNGMRQPALVVEHGLGKNVRMHGFARFPLDNEVHAGGFSAFQAPGDGSGACLVIVIKFAGRHADEVFHLSRMLKSAQHGSIGESQFVFRVEHGAGHGQGLQHAARESELAFQLVQHGVEGSGQRADFIVRMGFNTRSVIAGHDFLGKIGKTLQGSADAPAGVDG